MNGNYKTLLQSENGTNPIFRNKDYRASTRRLEKKRKKKNWQGSYKSCIFIPPTPGEKLRKREPALARWQRRMAHKNDINGWKDS